MTEPSAGVGLLVGIDLGSQSAKVVVHEPDGTLVASAQRPLAPTVAPEPGQAEHPGDDLWDALVVACSSAMTALGSRRDEVRAVGLCGIRFCRALLRADGSLAAPVQSWMDARVAAPADLPPGLRADVAHVVASSGYLTARLTGRVRDSAAAYALGQPPADELVEPGEVLGVVTSAAAAATGLPAGVPVVATANDKAVEALGCGLLTPGPLLVSLGTYVAAITVGTGPTGGASYWTNPAAVPGTVLHESVGVRRGMWTVAWVRDLVGHHVGAGDETALGVAAAEVPVGSDGLLTVLDWLAPDEAPWRRGAFVGLDVRHGPAHLYRSVLEAVASTVSRHGLAMTAELGVDPTELVVSGGGSRSPLLLAMLAACLDRPVATVAAPSAAGLGAALTAAVGVGLLPSWSSAVAAMVRRTDPVSPDPAWVPAYADLGERLRALGAALDPVLRDLDRGGVGPQGLEP